MDESQRDLCRLAPSVIGDVFHAQFFASAQRDGVKVAHGERPSLARGGSSSLHIVTTMASYNAISVHAVQRRQLEICGEKRCHNEMEILTMNAWNIP